MTLEQLWRLRYLQRLTEFESALASSRASLLPHDFVCLEVSLLRSKGQVSQAQQLLAEVPPIEQGFHYYLQRAMNALAMGDHTFCMDQVVNAKVFAETDFEWLIVELNLLIGLHNLQLAVNSQLVKVKNLLETCQDKELKNFIERVIRTMRFRQQFSCGDWSFLQEELDADERGQALYFKIFCSALPYVFSEKNQHDLLLTSLMSRNGLHLKNFRLRTLLQQDHFSDEAHVELKDRVDRLYLWTWKWLMDPSESHLKHLEQGVAELEQAMSLQSDWHRFTSEDLAMLRNALGWMSLFRKQLPQIQIDSKILEKLRGMNFTKTPMLDMERDMIVFLRLKMNKEKSALLKMRQLRSHSVFKNSAHWSQILRHLQWRLDADAKSTQITVDTRNSTIEKGQQRQISEPLTKFVSLLMEREHLHFSEILQTCYEIKDYDSLVHSQKIHNLIQKAKKLLGSVVELKTRQQTLYVMNVDAAKLILKSQLAQPLVVGKNSLQTNGKVFYQKTFFKIYPFLKENQTYSRQQLQVMMKLSKATANRHIQNWIHQGYLKPFKAGRATNYRIEK